MENDEKKLMSKELKKIAHLYIKILKLEKKIIHKTKK